MHALRDRLERRRSDAWNGTALATPCREGSAAGSNWSMATHRKAKDGRSVREKLRAIERRGGVVGILPDCPPDVADKFLAHVMAYESAEAVCLFDVLRDGGLALPAPEDLDDATIGKHLARIVEALALLNVYLHCTDHLSDLELYAYLWSTALREPTVLLPQVPEFSYHIDLVGSGSREDFETYLRYYADEQARRSWREEWPNDPIPAHEDPPYDRDRHLPQPHTAFSSGAA